MSLHQTIKDSMKEALKAHEDVRLTTLRSLLSAFQSEAMAQKRKPDEELSDEDALKVITRSVKQRRDSIEQFQKGGRQDLVDKESAELAMLEAYLPEMMSREEVEKIVRAKQAELGISDKKEMGKLMGAVMMELKGRADGATVKEITESLLS